MKIGVIGAGRLGICFALLCEAAGYEVLVSDIREDYVKGLNERRIDSTEPEVDNLLKVAKYDKETSKPLMVRKQRSRWFYSPVLDEKSRVS